MIPIKDENPPERFPLATVVIIGLNVLIFLHQLSLGEGFQQFIWQMGTIPYELTHLVDLSPKSRVPIPLTLFTAMFTHGGFLHIGGNMLYLWIFGNNVEDSMGRLRFILFYLVCGVVASLAHVLVNADSKVPMVGASGAIAGILGAYVLLFPKARVLTLIFFGWFIRLVWLPAAFFLGFWLLLQVINASLTGATAGGVAWLAHIGGFGTGFSLVKLFARRQRGRRIYRY